ncbi:gamma-glutamylcyclotransferase [Psychromarinibacter halotolerans]|uniref:glutathione-specific gamma-glutamylcyclotransferase n=1 Tax=Psychromarinibacter halotolerans TaxID=1775175 RepID=A0ABV7GRS9_9RHOB|nr:gamma-glutamylcyclotransferase [Psychromarinibacter halotolerans]MDF0597878.1 gamma-glutamylcyclotransferase [Psychromarinibacter halotolerans]
MTDADLWVFGYGSLMWNPGFEYDRRELATLTGYARTFCMWSIHHRGTPEHPGLVLALDPHEDAECHGLGFRVPGLHRARTLDYLRERELVSSAYVERMLPLRLADGEEVEAVVYVVDTDHVQYCGGLALERQAEVISTAVGGRGPNTEYLFNTQSHLQELGIDDPDLLWLSHRVRTLAESV